MKNPWKAKAILKLLAFLPILVFNSFAHAECVEHSKSNANSTCIVMQVNGEKGVWLSLGEADALRRMKLESAELRFQISELNEIITIKDQIISFYLEINSVRRSNVIILQKQLDVSMQREIELRRKIGKWYRNPIFWFSVGITLSSVAYIAIYSSGSHK